MLGKFSIFFIVVACAIIFVDCEDEPYVSCGDSINCIEKKLIKKVDEIDDKMVPIVGDSILLSQTNSSLVQPRNDEDLVDRLVRYLCSHEVKIKLSSEAARSLIDGARSSKIKKVLLPLLLLLKLKGVIVITAVLAGIALLAFKGLGAGLVALAISGAVGLKTLLEGHTSSKFSYEVVPQISSPHWNRAGIDGAPVQGYYTIP